MLIFTFYLLTFALWPLADGRFRNWTRDNGVRRAGKKIRTGALQKPQSFYLFK